MRKKIELNPEQVAECLRLYNEELLGSNSISEKMGFHQSIILRTLKENGVVMGPSGRRNTGGKPAADKRYRDKNKEKLDEYYKDWANDNKKHLRDAHTDWRNANREKVRKWARDYERTRRAEDPRYRLIARTRTSVSTCLKERNIAKKSATFVLLGYTIEDLMMHLESLFTEGMTWDNYGEWHVDHKRPMTSFNFETTEDPEFHECWKLDNLQPLWGPDNLSKGTKLL